MTLIYVNFLARRKRDESRHPPTGGGKPLPPLSTAEELYTNLFQGQPKFNGLSGIDTAGIFSVLDFLA